MKDKRLELEFFRKQRLRLEEQLDTKKIDEEDILKLEYLSRRFRKIEYALGIPLSLDKKLINSEPTIIYK